MDAAITSKGQITIPKRVRDALGLVRGDRVEFLQENGVAVIRKLVRDDANPFLQQVGILEQPGEKRIAVERQREDRGWDDWDREHFR